MLQFTVYRDGPWWVGVLAWTEGETLYAARHRFETEPQNEEIFAFVLHDWLGLFNHCLVGVPWDSSPDHSANPKRRGRDVIRQAAQHGVDAQVQEALDRSRQRYRQGKG